jgi:hypothetical protein
MFRNYQSDWAGICCGQITFAVVFLVVISATQNGLAGPIVPLEASGSLFSSGRGGNPFGMTQDGKSSTGIVFSNAALVAEHKINGQGVAAGGSLNGLNVPGGLLRIGSCAGAQTPSGFEFIGDGLGSVTYDDTFDVVSSTLAPGTEVSFLLRYGASTKEKATHSFGPTPAPFHSSAFGQFEIDFHSDAAAQNSYSEIDLTSRFSYDPSNPVRDGIFNGGGSIIDVTVNAVVGSTFTLEMYFESDTTADVNFVDNDGFASLTACALFGISPGSDFQAVSQLTGSSAPLADQVTHANLSSCTPEFPPVLPEPSTLLLGLMGSLGLLMRRTRRRAT